MDGAVPADATNEKLSRGLMAYGLAAMTTDPLVVASVGFACLAYWAHSGPDAGAGRQLSQARIALAEGALLAGLLAAVTVLFSARGVLPFR